MALTRTNLYTPSNFQQNTYGGRDMRAGQMQQAQSSSPLTNAMQFYNSPEYRLGSNMSKIYDNAMNRQNDGIYTVDGNKVNVGRSDFEGWTNANGKPLTDKQMYELVNQGGVNPAQLGDASQQQLMMDQGFKYNPQLTLRDIAAQRSALDPKLGGPLTNGVSAGTNAANAINSVGTTSGGMMAGTPITNAVTSTLPQSVGSAVAATTPETIGASIGSTAAETAAAEAAAAAEGAAAASGAAAGGSSMLGPIGWGLLGGYMLGKKFHWI